MRNYNRNHELTLMNTNIHKNKITINSAQLDGPLRPSGAGQAGAGRMLAFCLLEHTAPLLSEVYSHVN